MIFSLLIFTEKEVRQEKRRFLFTEKESLAKKNEKSRPSLRWGLIGFPYSIYFHYSFTDCYQIFTEKESLAKKNEKSCPVLRRGLIGFLYCVYYHYFLTNCYQIFTEKESLAKKNEKSHPVLRRGLIGFLYSAFPCLIFFPLKKQTAPKRRSSK